MKCISFSAWTLVYTLTVPLFSARAQDASVSKPRSNVRDLAERADCNSNPAYQLTPDAWIKADTDLKFRQWSSNTSSKSHGFLVNELGKQFGPHFNRFECGINKFSTCNAPACSDFNEDTWAYLVLSAIVHLNTFFNSIYDGITNGQLDFSGLADDLALLFFPTKEPTFPLDDVSFFLIAILTIFATITSVIFPPAAVAVLGANALANAGIQELTLSLKPEFPRSVKLAEIQSYEATKGVTARHNVERWANNTFAGMPDSSNNTILDYTAGGAYIAPDLPSNTQFEDFYKKQMISRIINTQWVKERYFVVFSSTNDTNVATGPPEGRYYSKEDGGVYYLYSYVEDGTLRGHLDAPKNLDKLSNKTYDITGSDIAKASGTAWRQGNFNYTREMAGKRIMASVASNNTLNPFKDGAGWEGTWTLPVCDIGKHPEWNSHWGRSAKKNRYDFLPCCCGPNCRDTKAFVKAANLHGFQTLLRACKDQLRGSDADYATVDYGFKWKRSLTYTFAYLNGGQRFGVVLGILAAILVVSIGMVAAFCVLSIMIACRNS